MVALTLGVEGALLATPDGVIRMPAMDVPMHSSVGAGDAFLAATSLALARGATPTEALAWGTAAGPLPSPAPVRQGCGVSTWRRGSGNCAAVHCRRRLQDRRHSPVRGERGVTVRESQQRLCDIGGGGSRGHAAQLVRVGLQLISRTL